MTEHDQYSRLSRAQQLMLARPHAPGNCTPAEVRQLVRRGLLDHWVSTGLYFTSAKGKRVLAQAMTAARPPASRTPSSAAQENES